MTTFQHDLGSFLAKISAGDVPAEMPPGMPFRLELAGIAQRISSLSDDLARLRVEAALSRSENLRLRKQEFIYRSVFDNAVVGIIITSNDDTIIDINHAVEYMLGYQKDELKTLTLSDLTLPEDHENDEELKQDVIAGRRLYYHVEKRYVRNDGILFWGMVTVFVAWDETGTPSLIHMLEDISARKSAEQQLEHASTRDALTGLYNRGYFDNELNRYQFRMLLPVSVVVIDVDGLKQINDSMGHEAGDRLIIGVATILKEAFRGDDTVARVGGDEFSILLPETGEEAIVMVVERLRKCQARFNEASPGFQVNFSLGSATAFKGEEIPKALKLADERMYSDKIMNKGTRVTREQCC